MRHNFANSPFQQASSTFAVLKQYENNWATSAMVQQYIQSRRKALVKAGILPRKPNTLFGTAEERKERAKKANACRRPGRQSQTARRARELENLDPQLHHAGIAGN